MVYNDKNDTFVLTIYGFCVVRIFTVLYFGGKAMTGKKITATVITAALLSASLGGISVSAEETGKLFSAKFDFGKFQTADGYTEVTGKTLYTSELGYGFVSTDGLKEGGKDVIEDYVTSVNGEFTFVADVPDGDYEVKFTNGGDTETETNVYINDGERVRLYTIEAGKCNETTQRVVPKDGKITFTFKGKDVKTNAIEITQLESRTEKGEKPTIYIAGDSTAQTYNAAKTYPQTGWGQVISDYFTDDVLFDNRSMAGRSSKSYNNDGRLDNILTQIKPGDYLLIQFGHNDGSSKPERYISIDDFKKLIGDKYIGETVKRGGIPVVLSPTPHYSPDENGKFAPTILDYSQAAKEIAEEKGVLFIDVQQAIADRWNELGADEVKKMYFINEQGESVAYPDGTDDHTHFKEAGAREVAQLVAATIAENVQELEPYVYTEENPIVFKDTVGHWSEELISTAANKHIVKGISKDEFAPEQKITRAEFISLIMRANKINGKAWRNEECYADVTAEDWFRFDLQGAMDKGIVPEEMVSENKILPNEYITRQEMAAVAVKAYEYTNSVSTYLKMYPIVDSVKDANDVAQWAKPYVEAAVMYKIINGSVDENGDIVINPNKNATRAEAVAVAMRCVK